MPVNMNNEFLTVEASDSMILFRGEPGGDGPQGPAGPAATIEIGTTTTLPAGSNATVTNSGTDRFAILNFGIPKGADGEGVPTWGTITGDIDDQTDLQTALSAKADTADLGSMALVDDVPSDNAYYFRRNQAWIAYQRPTIGRTSVTVYVDSVDGSDDNSGAGSFSNAYKTLEKAYSQAPDFGKLTINLKAGTYTAPATTVMDKYEIEIKLHGDVTISGLYFNNCKSVVIKNNSTTQYTLTTSKISIRNSTYMQIDNSMVITGSGNIDNNIYLLYNCRLIASNLTLNVTSSNQYYAAIEADTLCEAYFKDLDITAATGIRANRGSVVSYKSLTGTMTTQIETSNGGRVYTGSQS